MWHNMQNEWWQCDTKCKTNRNSVTQCEKRIMAESFLNRFHYFYLLVNFISLVPGLKSYVWDVPGLEHCVWDVPGLEPCVWDVVTWALCLRCNVKKNLKISLTSEYRASQNVSICCVKKFSWKVVIFETR